MHLLHQQRNVNWRCFARQVGGKRRITIARNSVTGSLHSIRTLKSNKAALSTVQTSVTPVFFSTISNHEDSLPPLKHVIRPFLLKCHPDMVQQEQPEIKQVNLAAIQNLNLYVDTIQKALSHSTTSASLRKLTDRIKIEFFIIQENASIKKKHALKTHYTRRGVELAWPAADQPPDVVHVQALNELYKLMHVAGLTSEKDAFLLDGSDDDALEDAYYDELGFGKDGETKFDDNDGMDSPFGRSTLGTRFAPGRKKKPMPMDNQSVYERNRDRFTAKINWKKYDEVYERTLADLRANMATSGLYNTPARRIRVISELLSRVRVKEEDDLNFVETWVAMRRLSLILMDKFDEMRMEDLAVMWENCHFVLTKARPYSASGSAMRRRKLKGGGDSGYSFTLHPDYSVTIEIPIDFRDDELIHELDQNIWDFNEIIGDGMEGIFPKTWQTYW